MNPYRKTTAVLIAVVLFLTDYFFQPILVGYLQRWGGVIELNDFLSLRLYQNFNLVFSLPAPSLLILLASAVVWIFFSLIFFLEHSPTWLSAVGYGLIAAGSLANFQSRLATGFVWDYLAIRLGPWQGIWNFPDIIILLGIIIWIYASRRNPTRTNPTPATDESFLRVDRGHRSGDSRG